MSTHPPETRFDSPFRFKPGHDLSKLDSIPTIEKDLAAGQSAQPSPILKESGGEDVWKLLNREEDGVELALAYWRNFRGNLDYISNWLNPDWEDLYRTNFFGASKIGKWKADLWTRRINENLKDALAWQRGMIRKPFFPQIPVMYVVGSGPSLAKNYRALINRTAGVLIGVNAVTELIPTDSMGIYCVLEPQAPESWFSGKDFSKTICVADLRTNPAFKLANWRSILWMFSVAGFYGPCKALMPLLPDILKFESGYTIGVTALQLAWQFRPEVIVFAGMDFSWPGEDVHFYRSRASDHWQDHEILKIKDIQGNDVYSTEAYIVGCRAMIAACYFLSKSGVRIINATEGGLLSLEHLKGYARIEQRRLWDVVKEMEGWYGKRTKIERALGERGFCGSTFFENQ